MSVATDGAGFSALAARQRAHRSYLPDPVSREVLQQVLADAMRAPSAENRQPWQFVVVTDEPVRREIWALATKAWEGGGRETTRTTLTTELHADVDRGMTGGFLGAPVAVVVGADLDLCPPELVGSSVFPAVQNLLLSATAHGLGSALTTISTVFSRELAGIVGFPDNLRPVAVIPLGYPATELGRSRRDPVAEHAHAEQFGGGWDDRRKS